ncbi:wiskott-Aldrich syndrome protein family member 3-like [Scyliorhinus canicula]|uniref:wiskott-Aldrich syndrome protein family member 3-like n=1 Tax=Scyliorhinus canicula TaxID=7830 RepID=UPI0018F52085|nr:wiskott-Aldrich syndrome protein family member 3-like [Scyliorhinus canicula]XP_038631497.1 wiskott-Aldrich syndrome protein family member 3-like [Scyliorhinus canicula]XP_038631498.1 wiskott-Aldrich syndrome protein family member 3-like [Scyliorhinus canicula]XP_038631499.1 wiskott-Aldrich syndrome protein family member 3-like [Scyliorhinus canicula]XP_038631500.1 wiskott-Aldrich syndrome protein family member 3-like [Scyliorhinus canicula]XP_038631501.1 wiskott-Aldrich syndrome protein fa
MPLIKRIIEPRHLCRGALPEGVTSELECVTNSTLAAIIKQLGSLSRHAEDIFGELFNEANNFCMRVNSLQERIDCLAIKVTQLDSTVEEVSLQDINMRKAFKSSTTQDQQVVSRNTIPNPVLEMFQQCDKPPPLNILTPYRDDRKDGLKFYTDSSYFFNLWKEKMLQATEDKRKEKRRQKEQKLVEDATREVKKVRKARTRRPEWDVMGRDKEFRADHRFSPSPYHAASSEGSVSPDTRSYISDVGELSYPASPNHPVQQSAVSISYVVPDNKELLSAVTQAQDRAYRLPATNVRQTSLTRTQQPHLTQPVEATLNGPRPQLVKDYSAQPVQLAEYYPPPAPAPPPPPPPLIPSAQTAFDSPISAPPPLALSSVAAVGRTYTPSPPPPAPPLSYTPPPPGPPAAPPPPPPGPPLLVPSPLHSALPPTAVEIKKAQATLMPISDARSDLLAAIRRGIQLRKVQEQREQEAKKEPVGNDVATILSRRIAVEYSESDDDSELDENEWSD